MGGLASRGKVSNVHLQKDNDETKRCLQGLCWVCAYSAAFANLNVQQSSVKDDICIGPVSRYDLQRYTGLLNAFPTDVILCHR